MTAWKWHFEWRHTSSLPSLVQVVMAPFIFFSCLKCQDESCQKLQKFVELCQSYAQNISGSIFFRTWCIYSTISQELHVQILPKFQCARLSYGLGLILFWQCCAIFYVLPVFWMTSRLHFIAQNRRREKDIYLKWLTMDSSARRPDVSEVWCLRLPCTCRPHLCWANLLIYCLYPYPFICSQNKQEIHMNKIAIEPDNKAQQCTNSCPH